MKNMSAKAGRCDPSLFCASSVQITSHETYTLNPSARLPASKLPLISKRLRFAVLICPSFILIVFLNAAGGKCVFGISFPRNLHKGSLFRCMSALEPYLKIDMKDDQPPILNGPRQVPPTTWPS